MTDPSSAPTSAVTVDVDDDGVVLVRIDDGKANAVSPDVIAALHSSLDRAEAEGRAVLLVGRPGRFSAGFDLSIMQQGVDTARALVRSGAELALRIYEFPQPVVMACTGHALAMGVIMLLAGDVRIGADGDFKLGLNEVAIGMPVPAFATELARDRLSPRHFTRAVSHAEIYSPAGAVDAGYLDEVVAAEDLLAVATERARYLADRVKPAAFGLTRTNARSATVRLIRDSLDADLALFDIAT